MRRYRTFGHDQMIHRGGRPKQTCLWQDSAIVRLIKQGPLHLSQGH